MPKNRLDPNVERKRHHHAFEVYRDLGFRRTYRETARQVGAAVGSVCSWAKLYHWEERLNEYKWAVEKKKEEGALVKIDDPVVQKMVTLLEQTEALIDSAFIRDDEGRVASMVKITNPEDLARIIGEYRKILESYYRFIAEYKPAGKEQDRHTKIDKFNVFMGNVSQEERIAMVKGLVNGNVPAGNQLSSDRVQNADYTEVSERRDAD